MDAPRHEIEGAHLHVPKVRSIMMLSPTELPYAPVTEVLRRICADGTDPASLRDLVFLERWEMLPLPGAAAALRVSQIRRANPDLAAAIRSEVARLRA